MCKNGSLLLIRCSGQKTLWCVTCFNHLFRKVKFNWCVGLSRKGGVIIQGSHPHDTDAGMWPNTVKNLLRDINIVLWINLRWIESGVSATVFNYLCLPVWWSKRLGLSFILCLLVGVETMWRERKHWPLHVQSGFPLNFQLREEEHARTAALCFLCGQPAATGNPYHAMQGPAL